MSLVCAYFLIKLILLNFLSEFLARARAPGGGMRSGSAVNLGRQARLEESTNSIIYQINFKNSSTESPASLSIALKVPL